MNWAAIGDYTIWHQGGAHWPTTLPLVLCAIAFSLLLYRLRCIRPFQYGCIEVAVGLAVLIFTFDVPTTHYLAFDRQTVFEWGVNRIIGTMAGIYIIIRGLDNMDRDLPPSWRPLWDSFFPKQKPTGRA